MRFILLITLITGCTQTATQVTPPITTAAASEASCSGDESVAIEIKVEVAKPTKHAFDIGECR